MKQIGETLQSLLNNEVSSFCNCVKLTLASGDTLGFTSHDEDVEIDSVIYKSANGVEIDNFREDISLKNDELKTLGLIDSENISDEDILSGKFDGAKIEILVADHNNISAGVVSLKKGYITEIISEGGKFSAKIESLSSKLKREITQVYSPLCTAKFGDSKCGFDRELLKVSGSISSVTDNRIFTDFSRSEEAGYFDYGVIIFTSGNNIGQKTEVKYHRENGVFELVLKLHKDIQIGDEYTLYPGCDKRFKTCKGKFSNSENFRGFPHVPGTDSILNGAG